MYKIVSVGNFTHGWDGSICDEHHIAQALEKLQYTVYRIDRADHSVLPDFQEDIDFVLLAQYDQYPPDWITRLKEAYNCPVVYWAFDYQADGQAWHEHLVSQVDLYLSKRIADAKYPNWQWLPQDFAPEFLDKYDAPVKKDIDVLFTGSFLDWATERNTLLKAVDKQFNLTIHSVTPDRWRELGFKNVNGPAMDNALPELIARAKINLSIDHTIERGYWSDRPAQIMACGGFVLQRYVPMIEQVLHTNVSYFATSYGCLEGIKYFLECEEDREVKAQEGYEYAHQYLQTINRVCDLVTIAKETFKL
jgi:hypothetical protein